MTAFNVALVLTADTSAARRDIRAAANDLQTIGQSAKTAGATAATGLRAAEAEVLQLRRASAGATSNLVAQFNDVGQMLAPGQSPLLLAAQQGTQIAQALGPLGAGGAVRALGGAFLGMLNPVNLAVFGSAAALGLLMDGLRGIKGEAQSVEDAIGDLEAATKSWREEASVGTDDLARRFGAVTPEIIAMQRQITELALVETLLKAADAAAALSSEFDSIFDLTSRSGDIAGLLGVANSVVVDDPELGAFRTQNPLVSQFDQQLQTLASDAGIETKIDAVKRLQDLLRGNVDLYAAENTEQRAFYRTAQDLERQLRLVQAAEAGIGSAQQVAKDKAEQMLATLKDEANIRRQAALYGEDSRQATEARVEAERRAFEAMLAGLEVSETLKGSLRDAWDAANGMQGSAADVVTALLDAAGAGDDIQRAIRDAWDLLTGTADATNIWSSAMSDVAAEVRGIGAALATLGAAGIENASKEIELSALRSGKSVSEAKRAAQEDEFRRDAEINEAKTNYVFAQATLKEQLDGLEIDRQLEAERRIAAERDRRATRGSSGGGAGAAQTAGPQRLIATLERELDLLRATDPLQKELIRNREAMASATSQERAQVEALIAAKLREQEAQDRARETWEFTRQTAFDALEALIVQGESASEVMSNLAKSIASALLQSALLGTGPLAGLFGGQGSGLFDIIGGALGIPGAADGGFMSGPGGPRDDAIVARLSNGEFVVNAAATARHRPLLEAINSAPRFAAGGFVGGAAASLPGASAGGPIVIDLRLTDDLDARIAEQSEGVSVRVLRGGLEQYDAKVLPRRLKAISGDPRRVG
ncbi:MAG: phage tail length tape measure family protein [Pseudomonadota bacterium]